MKRQREMQMIVSGRRATLRRRSITLAGAALLAAGACVGSRGTPRPEPPADDRAAATAAQVTGPASAAPATPTSPAAAAPTPVVTSAAESGALGGAQRRNQFEGADLSPKPPVQPLSPSDEAKRFLLPPGYRMTPILTEPAIQQPAAISFDGNGRMFVLELRTYMLDADARDQLAPLSRISRWDDRDDDGVYETHTVFVDSLVFPRFAMPYGANTILSMESNSNDVFKYIDTNGDGRADRKELFTTNFGRLANVEHLQSSLFWAMDNWLYSTVNAFRVRETPRGVIREPTGFNDAAWGASQDDDGTQWFQNGWLGVPGYFQFPIVYGTFVDSNRWDPDFDVIWGAPIGLADMQGGMPVVRKPDGSLMRGTAGSGSNVHRGHRLPKELEGDYFHGEVVGRVVRRIRPEKSEGLTRLRNVYAEERSEFIRSTDPLFRPIEIKTAPDGSMYVVDMYHGIIQESQWTPKGSYIRAKIEQYQLDKIIGLGRIWRLTHDSLPRDTRKPRMYDETPAQLVRHLRHPNGWWRDVAQQELVLRKDRSVAPALRAMVRRDTMLVARFHALWALEGLGALDAALVREVMRDASPRMRIQAVRASETLYKNGDTALAADWRRLARDPSPDVVIQAMMTLNTLRVPDAAAVIRATMAANAARGVQLVGRQILDAPSTVAGRNFPPALREVMERGAAVYREACASCHGADGTGVVVANGQRMAPALAGSPRVTGHPTYVTKVLLHGLTGPIEGTTYAGQIMVSQGQQPDRWIADVASYIRNAFTNAASFVTPEQVAAVRAANRSRTAAWTYPELAASVPVLMHQQASWKATASHESDRAVRAFGTAGWSTMVPQQPGMWFQFELPEQVTLAEMRFLSNPSGPPQRQGEPRPVPYARGWEVRVSMDGAQWSEPVAQGQGTGPATAIVLNQPVRARVVRITQTATTESAPPWGIQQLQLYALRDARR